MPTIVSSLLAPPLARDRASSIGERATPISWSNTGRWCSISRCASACTRSCKPSRQAIGLKGLAGIIDQTPGIRSLQIHYDPRVLPLEDLIAALQSIEDALGDLSDMEVDSREVRLPLSWNDEAVQLTIDKYMRGVRADAPWCPSNIEFIRRINGLESDRRGEAYRVRRDLSRARPGRRLSRRAGGDAGRSASPAGHHQIQPGAHLDA